MKTYCLKKTVLVEDDVRHIKVSQHKVVASGLTFQEAKAQKKADRSLSIFPDSTWTPETDAALADLLHHNSIAVTETYIEEVTA
jgi:hypothetical protein